MKVLVMNDFVKICGKLLKIFRVNFEVIQVLMGLAKLFRN